MEEEYLRTMESTVPFLSPIAVVPATVAARKSSVESLLESTPPPGCMTSKPTGIVVAQCGAVQNYDSVCYAVHHIAYVSLGFWLAIVVIHYTVLIIFYAIFYYQPKNGYFNFNMQ